MSSQLGPFIERHFETILANYLQLVRATVHRYQYAEPPLFEHNTRRLISCLARTLDSPHDPEVMAFLDDFSRQRVGSGMQMGEILEAMFLYDDVILPLIIDEFEASDERTELILDLQRSVQVMGLRFAETFVALQMAIFEQQRLAVLELSTPVLRIWEGIVTLPLIGTIDSYRAKRIMEELLRVVSEEQADIVLIDITGVPVVDTNVADHLIRTIKAVELLGAECLVVGIGPELAQTVVALGVDLSNVSPPADMGDGLTEAFRRRGLAVVPRSAAAAAGLV